MGCHRSERSNEYALKVAVYVPVAFSVLTALQYLIYSMLSLAPEAEVCLNQQPTLHTNCTEEVLSLKMPLGSAIGWIRTEGSTRLYVEVID